MTASRAARWLGTVALVVAVAACSLTVPSSMPSASRQPVQAAPDPQLVDFETHIEQASRAHGRLVEALAKASAGPTTGLRGPARQMADWASAELTWLDLHPAELCYEEAADTYRGGVEAILTAATAFETMATASASAPPSEAEAEAAGKGLSDGGSAIQLGSLEAFRSRASCRS